MTPYKEHKGPKDVDESTDSYDTIDWLIHNIAHSVPRVAITERRILASIPRRAAWTHIPPSRRASRLRR